jgi:hypothetical protein
MESLLSTTAIMLPCAALLPSTAEMSACLARHARIRRDKLEGETVATANIKAPRCAGDASRQPHRAQRLIRLPSQIHAPAPLVLVQHCVVRCLAQLCTQPWGWQALAPHSLHHSIGTLAPENSRAHRQRRCEAQAAVDCAPRTAHQHISRAPAAWSRGDPTHAGAQQAGRQADTQAGRQRQPDRSPDLARDPALPPPQGPQWRVPAPVSAGYQSAGSQAAGTPRSRTVAAAAVAGTARCRLPPQTTALLALPAAAACAHCRRRRGA